MIKKLLVGTCLFLLFNTAYAGHSGSLINCGLQTIEAIHVIGSSDDGDIRDRIFVKFYDSGRNNDCKNENIMYVYLDNSDPSYETIASLSAMVKTIGIPVRFLLKGGSCNYINLDGLPVSAQACKIREMGFY